MFKKRSFAFPSQKISGHENLTNSGMTVEEYSVFGIAAHLSCNPNLEPEYIAKRSLEVTAALIKALNEEEDKAKLKKPETSKI